MVLPRRLARTDTVVSKDRQDLIFSVCHMLAITVCTSPLNGGINEYFL